MLTLYATVGLPRSGKSTWARQTGLPIVCPDAIRLALHGETFIAQAEPYVWAIAKTMVLALFEAGCGVVVFDACNTTRKRRRQWIFEGVITRWVIFDDDERTCLYRAQADRPDLFPVIRRMAAQFEPVSDAEFPPPCCSSCHSPPDTACKSFVESLTGNCVYCAHEEKCHPGPGAVCEICNLFPRTG